MRNLGFVFAVIFYAGFTLTCRASTLYNVGDSSGWDISTDLDSWQQGKTFVVGDLLWFQYSSNHNVSEVTRENYQRCNTTNVLQSYTGGNTTLTMSSPGDKYFICSTRLHCLGGMKLHVHVEEDQTTPTVAPTSSLSAPQAQPLGGGGSLLPHHSSKSNYNYPSSVPNLISFNFTFLRLLGLVLLIVL
ncbi:hypothetical protein Leryth_020201 [Lithospermum erythrorhizon]|nr:hypothetical protein Leryth_020201 [Lithospermum erythrorhizon]